MLGFHIALAQAVKRGRAAAISWMLMHLKKYLLEADPTLTVYEFTSEGPRGRIPKLVIIAETNQAGLYNLTLRDKNMFTSKLYDINIFNNEDSE